MPKPINDTPSKIQVSPIRVIANLAMTTPGCQSLSIGEPDFDTPLNIREAAIRGLRENHTHYPPFDGRPDYLEAVSRYTTEHYGLDYAPDEIIATVGATAAIYSALFTLLKPGDEVIIPTPNFNIYESVTTLCRGVPVCVDVSETGFQLDRERLERAISPRTQAIILTSPSNPTGHMFNRESLALVEELALREGFYLVCDEVYRDLVYVEDAVFASNIKSLRKQIVLCQSLSKPWAMTGWRIGYLCADRSLKPSISKTHMHMNTSAPNFTQDGGIEALRTDVAPMREEYRGRRDYTVERLCAMGLPVEAPPGAFYVFPDVRRIAPEGSEKLCMDLIREAGVALVPGTAFGTEGHVRLSYCYSREALGRGLDRLEAYIRKHGF